MKTACTVFLHNGIRADFRRCMLVLEEKEGMNLHPTILHTFIHKCDAWNCTIDSWFGRNSSVWKQTWDYKPLLLNEPRTGSVCGLNWTSVKTPWESLQLWCVLQSKQFLTSNLLLQSYLEVLLWIWYAFIKQTIIQIMELLLSLQIEHFRL